MGLKLASVGGGSVEIITASTASNLQVTLPATTGTAVVESASSKTASAQAFVAENGIIYNKQTIATSTTIPAGYSAMSAGPVAVTSGMTVSVATGSRWIVI